MNYVLQCNDIFDEAARTANKICALVAEGARFRDLVVVSCDYERTAPIYAQVFASNNIPLNVDVGGKLIDHALTKHLRDVMSSAPWITPRPSFPNPSASLEVSLLCNKLRPLLPTDSLASEKISAILDTIEKVLGNQLITVQEFNNMFCTLCAACKLSDVPKFSDRVLFVAVTEYEPTFTPYLFITSANDNTFPAQVSDTDIITEQDINDMSIRIEPSPSLQVARSWKHAKNIMASATKGLFISYTETPTPLAKGFKQDTCGIASRTFARSKTLAAIGNKTAFADNETAIYYSSLSHASGLGDFKIPCLDPEPKNLTTGSELFFQNNTAHVTALENFCKCPYYHFLTSGLGLKKKDPLGTLSPAAIGTILHDIAEKIVRGEPWQTDNLFIKKQAKLMQKFLLRDIDESRYKPKYFEHKLEKKIGGITIKGIADRIDTDGSGFVVVDYKTGSAGHARLQVPLYMDFFGKAQSGYYLSLKDFSKKAVTLNDIPPALESASKAITEIKAGNISKNPIHKSICGYCPMGAMCGVPK